MAESPPPVSYREVGDALEVELVMRARDGTRRKDTHGCDRVAAG